MKKSTIVLLVIGVIILGIIIFAISGYNSLVKMEEEVNSAFSNIDTNLQRRADLIPNLVSTVKEARAKLAGASTVEEKANADSELTSALNRLMIVVENYPDLKSSENFRQLADELAGTENRIAVARRDYNEMVKKYNSQRKKFPTNILAGMFGFESKEYFEASDNASEVPNVEF